MTVQPGYKNKNLLKPAVLVVLLVGAVIFSSFTGLGERLGELRGWILSIGPWGPVVYVAIYIAAVVFAIPGSVISVMAGVLFGSFLGVILVSVASTLGASLAFLISRHMARDAIAGKLASNGKFRKLDRMTKEHGAILVAITRLVPIFPFILQLSR